MHRIGAKRAKACWVPDNIKSVFYFTFITRSDDLQKRVKIYRKGKKRTTKEQEGFEKEIDLYFGYRRRLRNWRTLKSINEKIASKNCFIRFETYTCVLLSLWYPLSFNFIDYYLLIYTYSYIYIEYRTVFVCLFIMNFRRKHMTTLWQRTKFHGQIREILVNS